MKVSRFKDTVNVERIRSRRRTPEQVLFSVQHIEKAAETSAKSVRVKTPARMYKLLQVFARKCSIALCSPLQPGNVLFNFSLIASALLISTGLKFICFSID